MTLQACRKETECLCDLRGKELGFQMMKSFLVVSSLIFRWLLPKDLKNSDQFGFLFVQFAGSRTESLLLNIQCVSYLRRFGRT